MRVAIAYSDGPVTNTDVRNWLTTWDAFAERMAKPEVAPKDGSYLLRGVCRGPRSSANVKRAGLVVLDCDHPDRSPREVHETLLEEGLAHVVVTTHSHALGAPRFRVWAPAEGPYGRERVEAATRRLGHLAGCSWAPESSRWAQVWYWPRIATSDAPFECWVGYGKRLVVPKVVRRRRSPSGGYATPARIALINEKYDIAALLVAHGYEPKGTRRLPSGERAEVFLHPWSESGIAGTLVWFDEERGKQVVRSYGSNDPLHSTKPLDAFDVLKILEKGRCW